MRLNSLPNLVKIDNRIGCLAKREAFITKRSETQFYKEIHVEMNYIGTEEKDRTKRTMKVQKQANSNTIVDLSKNIKDKSRTKFTQFNTMHFHPSIMRFLLDKAIEFNRKYIITDQR